MLRALVTSPASTKRGHARTECKSILAALAGVGAAAGLVSMFVSQQQFGRVTRSLWDSIAGVLDDERQSLDREIATAEADIASHRAEIRDNERGGYSTYYNDDHYAAIEVLQAQIEAARMRLAEIDRAEGELDQVEVDE